MYWCTTIPWFVQNPTLHYIAKGICPTRHCNAAENSGIICDSCQNQKCICRNRCNGIWSHASIILLHKTHQTTKEVCENVSHFRHEKTACLYHKNTAQTKT